MPTATCTCYACLNYWNVHPGVLDTPYKCNGPFTTTVLVVRIIIISAVSGQLHMHVDGEYPVAVCSSKSEDYTSISIFNNFKVAANI